MSRGAAVILVTGAVGRGKTSWLEQLYRSVAHVRSACGFFAISGGRPRAGGPAAEYRLSVIGQPGRYPWAVRRTGEEARDPGPAGAGPEAAAAWVGYKFCEATCTTVTGLISAQLAQGTCEICFLDEIGRLEVDDQGFARLLRQALSPRTTGDGAAPIVVAAVRKQLLTQVVHRFGIAAPLLLDLDRLSGAEAFRLAHLQLAPPFYP